jgi:hypothetical protein
MRLRHVSRSDRFTLARGVLVETSDDEVTLFHERTARYWQINSTAWRIVDGLSGGATVGEVADDLHADTGADPDRVLGDVSATVRSLLAARVLERSR